MKLVFLGAPGVGKGTQAELLCRDRGWTHISTGEILRDAVTRKTPLGRRAQEVIDRGDLVGDEVMLGLIRETLTGLGEDGFVMDGFPRTPAQAEGLDRLLEDRGEKLDGVLVLTAPDEELTQRLLGRGRNDDTPETVRHRLTVYRENTAPLVTYYEDAGLVRWVDGTGDIGEIQDRIRILLEGGGR